MVEHARPPVGRSGAISMVLTLNARQPPAIRQKRYELTDGMRRTVLVNDGDFAKS
jgi:hypothetical protein